MVGVNGKGTGHKICSIENQGVYCTRMLSRKRVREDEEYDLKIEVEEMNGLGINGRCKVRFPLNKCNRCWMVLRDLRQYTKSSGI